MAKRGTTTRRDSIVRAARSSLTQRGYDATTIGDLAAELGISKAAIAYYFPTKDTFLDEFLDPFLDELEAAIDAAPAEPYAVLDAYLTVLTHHREVAVWVDTDPAVARHEVHGGRIADLNQRVVSIISSNSRRKADRMRALGVLGGILRPVRESNRRDLTDHHDEIVVAALEGYAAPVSD